MTLLPQWFSASRHTWPSSLSASVEIVSYLLATSLLALVYVLFHVDLRIMGVAVILLLLALVFLSWTQLGAGRHPCFLFLSLMVLFQGGRLVAFALGAPIDPFQIVDLAPFPFAVSQNAEAIFLLAVLLSAISIYIPCRWNYKTVVTRTVTPRTSVMRYLRAAFWITLPFALLKNVMYFRYAAAHGGYLVLFTERNNLIESVPAVVRIVSVFLTPVFLALFVLEKEKRRIYLLTFLYFATSAFFLLIGSRSGTLTTILALWCVSRAKSSKPSKIINLVLLAGAILAIATFIGRFRDTDDATTSSSGPTAASFIEAQGTTAGVTEIAIQYRDLFAPYVVHYLINEIEGGFIAQDQSQYVRGRSLADDATVFVNPEAYTAGAGLGSTFLGEAYIAGAIPGVIFFSLLIGLGLRALYTFCRSQIGLFVSASLLPSVLWMARAGLFDWVSIAVRTFFWALILYLGWKFYTWLAQGVAFCSKSACEGLRISPGPGGEGVPSDYSKADA